jgi:hypothetical protein
MVITFQLITKPGFPPPGTGFQLADDEEEPQDREGGAFGTPYEYPLDDPRIGVHVYNGNKGVNLQVPERLRIEVPERGGE